jgi:hypothetical protein
MGLNDTCPTCELNVKTSGLASRLPPLKSERCDSARLTLPSSGMVADIRKLMHAVPFVPFTIHLADGGQLRVPTVDHVALSPTGRRVIVFANDDTHEIVSPLLVSRITVEHEGDSEDVVSQ